MMDWYLSADGAAEYETNRRTTTDSEMWTNSWRGRKRRQEDEENVREGEKKARTEEGTVMGGKNSNKDNTKVGGETCKTKKIWRALCAHVNLQAELHTGV